MIITKIYSIKYIVHSHEQVGRIENVVVGGKGLHLNASDQEASLRE